jgi:hypothetical protein
MHNNDPGSIRWADWDWRPLARAAIWLASGITWAAFRGTLSAAAIERLASEIALGWLLSFGLLTYLQILLATGVLRLALTADDLAYSCAERIVRIVLPRASFARAFVAAFTLELSGVLLALRMAKELL